MDAEEFELEPHELEALETVNIGEEPSLQSLPAKVDDSDFPFESQLSGLSKLQSEFLAHGGSLYRIEGGATVTAQQLRALAAAGVSFLKTGKEPTPAIDVPPAFTGEGVPYGTQPFRPELFQKLLARSGENIVQYEPILVPEPITHKEDGVKVPDLVALPIRPSGHSVLDSQPWMQAGMSVSGDSIAAMVATGSMKSYKGPKTLPVSIPMLRLDRPDLKLLTRLRRAVAGGEFDLLEWYKEINSAAEEYVLSSGTTPGLAGRLIFTLAQVREMEAGKWVRSHEPVSRVIKPWSRSTMRMPYETYERVLASLSPYIPLPASYTLDHPNPAAIVAHETGFRFGGEDAEPGVPRAFNVELSSRAGVLYSKGGAMAKQGDVFFQSLAIACAIFSRALKAMNDKKLTDAFSDLQFLILNVAAPKYEIMKRAKHEEKARWYYIPNMCVAIPAAIVMACQFRGLDEETNQMVGRHKIPGFMEQTSWVSLAGWSHTHGGVSALFMRAAAILRQYGFDIFVYSDNLTIVTPTHLVSVDGSHMESATNPMLAQYEARRLLKQHWTPIDGKSRVHPVWRWFMERFVPKYSVDAPAVFGNMILQVLGQLSGGRGTFSNNDARSCTFVANLFAELADALGIHTSAETRGLRNKGFNKGIENAGIFDIARDAKVLEENAYTQVLDPSAITFREPWKRAAAECSIVWKVEKVVRFKTPYGNPDLPTWGKAPSGNSEPVFTAMLRAATSDGTPNAILPFDVLGTDVVSFAFAGMPKRLYGVLQRPRQARAVGFDKADERLLKKGIEVDSVERLLLTYIKLISVYYAGGWFYPDITKFIEVRIATVRDRLLTKRNVVRPELVNDLVREAEFELGVIGDPDETVQRVLDLDIPTMYKVASILENPEFAMQSAEAFAALPEMSANPTVAFVRYAGIGQALASKWLKEYDPENWKELHLMWEALGTEVNQDTVRQELLTRWADTGIGLADEHIAEIRAKAKPDLDKPRLKITQAPSVDPDIPLTERGPGEELLSKARVDISRDRWQKLPALSRTVLVNRARFALGEMLGSSRFEILTGDTRQGSPGLALSFDRTATEIVKQKLPGMFQPAVREALEQMPLAIREDHSPDIADKIRAYVSDLKPPYKLPRLPAETPGTSFLRSALMEQIDAFNAALEKLKQTEPDRLVMSGALIQPARLFPFASLRTGRLQSLEEPRPDIQRYFDMDDDDWEDLVSKESAVRAKESIPEADDAVTVEPG